MSALGSRTRALWRAGALAAATVVATGSIAVALAPAATAATTVTVCASGCDATTIAAGIAAAAPGDTVSIAAGTYYEHNLVIDKALTLQGAGTDQTIIDGSDANDASDYGSMRIFGSPAGAIKVRDLSLTHPAKHLDPDTGNSFAVVVKSYDPTSGPITFDGVKIIGQGDPVNADYGIYVEGSRDLADPAFTFTNGSITNTYAQAILVENWRGPVTVSHSTLGQGTAVSASGHTTSAIWAFQDDGKPGRVTDPYLITDNTFQGTAASFYNWFNTPGFDNIQFTNNTVTGLSGLGTGVIVGRAYGTDPVGHFGAVTVTGNTISGDGSPVDDATHDTVGVTVGAAVDQATISNNALTGLTRGVLSQPAAAGNSVAVNGNRIVGDVYGLDVEPGAGATTADANWWGCNEGPVTTPTTCSRATGDTSGVHNWVVETVTADARSVGPNGTTGVHADLQHLNTGATTSPVPSAFDGVPVTFSASSGQVSPITVPLADGVASTTFTAPAGPGLLTIGPPGALGTSSTVTGTVDAASAHTTITTITSCRLVVRVLPWLQVVVYVPPILGHC